jgi:hypothetical protein
MIVLRAGENENVLITGMLVQGDGGALPIANEGGRGAVDSVSIEKMNLDAVAERFPGNLVLTFGNIEQIPELNEVAFYRHIRLLFHGEKISKSTQDGKQ